jgi:peptidoglycan hydrolase-like protein with peptidoglycan-binding domain
MTGRGAWPVSGLGGTKKYKDETQPGPYYYLGTGEKKETANEFAVHQAVRAYQRALRRRLNTDLPVTGYFGNKTRAAVMAYQQEHPKNLSAWGGIGPDTSRMLLMPDLRRVWKREAIPQLTLNIVSGTINHESQWDAGAVGYLDETDVGLAQINAGAHPEWTTVQRLQPITSFNFVIDYYNLAIPYFDGNVTDAIASYNLGRAGANRWISQGRPEWYTPLGSTRPRNMYDYVSSIVEG